MALRIATFNLKDFFLPRVPAEAAIVEAKVANVAAQLRRADADVVALQEVGSPELVTRLVERELGALGYGAPLFGSEDRRGIRNTILSRRPILWSQVHSAKSLDFPRFVATDAEPFPNRIPLRRGVVHVRVEDDGLGEVDVLTAHLKSNLPKGIFDAQGVELEDTTAAGLAESAIRSLVLRAAEALYLRKLVDKVFETSPDHAVCVLGDLNDTTESLPIRVVRGIDASGKHWLRECADLLPEEARYSAFHGGDGSLIDHVLVSERLYRSLRSYEIFNEALRDHGPHEGEVPLTDDSDHALCVAEFRA